MLLNDIERNACRFFHWVPVDSGADRWKTNRSNIVLLGQFEASPVTAGQALWLAVLTIPIYRAHGMKNVLSGQRAGACHYGIAGGASTRLGADLVQLTLDGGATGSMNGSVHTASAPQA